MSTQPSLFDGGHVASWATFGPELDAEGQPIYRYTLGRSWCPGPRILWVMLNPSTATAEVLDPTIRRCLGFSRSWGFGSLEVVNLFALRATDPDALWEHPAPVGGDDGLDNMRAIREAARRADKIVAAWGSHEAVTPMRGRNLHQILDTTLWCLGTTKSGAPRHPLYVRADQPLVEWKP